MAKEKTLKDLFHDTLKDIYFAEKKILTRLAQDGQGREFAKSCAPPSRSMRARPKTRSHASSRSSRPSTKPPKGKTCDAIIGIIEEGQEAMKEYKGTPALDAALLAAAQAVEHYEISRYGTLKTWAKELGLSEAAKLLDATLAEERKRMPTSPSSPKAW